MSHENIVFARENGIATVTLNRPKNMNALTSELIDELIQITWEISKDIETRVLIFTGAGEKAFCVGADLKSSIMDIQTKGLLEQVWFSQLIPQFITTTRNMPQPVIGAINGVAAGVGCALALACDIRIASTKAQFRPGFGAIGFHPEAGITYLLPHLVGISRAMEILLTSRMVNAQEAQEIGLVDRVVLPQELLPQTHALALQIAEGPPIVNRLIKQSLYRSASMDLASVADREAMTNVLLSTSEDHKEGVKALLGERAPKFKGR